MKIQAKTVSRVADGLTWVDADIWASRSRHWLNGPNLLIKTKKSPRRTREPLIVTGHAAGLAVRNGTLCVRDGYTHYPQKRAEYRFFPKDPNLPSRIVIVDGSGRLSFAAIDWLSEQGVPLIRVNWRGQLRSVLACTGYSADPQKVVAQKVAQRERVKISANLIHTKIENSMTTLKEFFPASSRLSRSLEKLAAFKRQLSAGCSDNIASLLSIEGNAALIYFDMWQALEISWKGTGRHPIPQDWYRIGPRSSLAREKLKNRNAAHPANAMLNYGYGVLESHVRLAIISEGLDPTISYLHSEKKYRHGLVFDLMEPLRPVVDGAILSIIKKETFHPSDFKLRSDGVCRLNPELARLLARRILERISNADCKTGVGAVRRDDRRKTLQLSKM